MSFSWGFAENEHGQIHLYRDGVKARSKDGTEFGEVMKIKSGKNSTTVKIVCSGTKGTEVDRTKFCPTFSKFSQKFEGCQTNAEFVTVFLNGRPAQTSSSQDCTDVSLDSSFESTTSSDSSSQAAVDEPPRKKTKACNESDNKIQLSADEKIEKKSKGVTTLPLNCLVAPPTRLQVRQISIQFVEVLKGKLRKNPQVGSVIIPVLLKEKHNSEKPDKGTYYTLGGNHLRVALEHLTREEKYASLGEKIHVCVYEGLTDDEGLRVASLHNDASHFTHLVNFQDEVDGSRNVLMSEASNTTTEIPTPSHQWRRKCMEALGKEPSRKAIHGMEVVFGVAQYPHRCYEKVKELFSLWNNYGLKDDKKLSKPRRPLGSTIFSRMKGLRGEEKFHILSSLTNGDIAMKEACQKADEYKKMDIIKRAFVWEAKFPSWEEATRQYPQHTSTDSLGRFLSCQFDWKNKKFPVTFVDFVKAAQVYAASAEEGFDSTAAYRIPVFDGHILAKAVTTPLTKLSLTGIDGVQPTASLAICQISESATDSDMGDIALRGRQWAGDQNIVIACQTPVKLVGRLIAAMDGYKCCDTLFVHMKESSGKGNTLFYSKTCVWQVSCLREKVWYGERRGDMWEVENVKDLFQKLMSAFTAEGQMVIAAMHKNEDIIEAACTTVRNVLIVCQDLEKVTKSLTEKREDMTTMLSQLNEGFDSDDFE